MTSKDDWFKPSQPLAEKEASHSRAQAWADRGTPTAGLLISGSRLARSTPSIGIIPKKSLTQETVLVFD